MLKKTITYTDFNGIGQTEDHFFHLSAADLVELEVSKKGGLSVWLQTIIDSEDGATIMAEFKKLILAAYGQKSDDGKRFIKSDAIREEFLSSEAFSEMFVEMCTNAEAAAEFATGIIPPNMAKLQAGVPQASAAVEEEAVRDKITPRIITRAEALEMTNEELTEAVAGGAVIKTI